ncbi:MAG: glycoside hydrolase family 16 protein [Beijerinckiaceae bacterium]
MIIRQSGTLYKKINRAAVLIGLLAVSAAGAIWTYQTYGHAQAEAAGNQLDLSGFRLTFSEEFNDLDVSAWGPGTRWIAHTPWYGDFGDAQFADPVPGFPFVIEDGILRIEARKGEDGKWRTGLLASTDPKGAGFTQQYGYFEMSAKLPSGVGVWPAFWLIANKEPNSSAEIDILEHYGVGPQHYESVVHVWPKEGRGRQHKERIVHDIPLGSLYDRFNTFGALVEADWITFYFNRKPMGRVATPPEHHHPMFILLNLAIGGGWPIDKTPSPSFMYVDYVRVWARN